MARVHTVSPWVEASKSAILAEIHRRQRTGESLRYHEIEREKWGCALLYRTAPLFGSWTAALSAAGIERIKENSPWRHAGKGEILAEIRRRVRAGETLQMSKLLRQKWGSPLITRCRVLFGSWREALLASGVDALPRLASPWTPANKAEIVAEIRGRRHARDPVYAKEIENEKWGRALLQRGRVLFGSWNAALSTAGLEPSRRAPSRWANAHPAEILAEIRSRQRADQSVRYIDISRGKWGKPLLRRASELFGTWNQTLRAANIEPVHAKSPWPGANKEAVIVEIRRRHRAHEELRSSRIRYERWGKPLMERAGVLFGTWTKALRAAGIKPPVPENRKWTAADTAAVLKEIRRRSRAGETLRARKLNRAGTRPLLRRARKMFGSWGAALVAAGVESPLPPRNSINPWLHADRDAVLEEIRRRNKAGESLQATRINRESRCYVLLDRARTLFGSWNDALLAAGPEVAPRVRFSPWTKVGRVAILAEIRRRKRTGETLRYGKVRRERERWGFPFLRRSVTLFGSWHNALAAAGVAPEAPAWGRWRNASKPAILAEIRHRQVAGKSLRFTEIRQETRGTELLQRAKELYGSWDAALTEAGIPNRAIPKILNEYWRSLGAD